MKFKDRLDNSQHFVIIMTIRNIIKILDSDDLLLLFYVLYFNNALTNWGSTMSPILGYSLKLHSHYKILHSF
jgi:hypothetical protein